MTRCMFPVCQGVMARKRKRAPAQVPLSLEWVTRASHVKTPLAKSVCHLLDPSNALGYCLDGACSVAKVALEAKATYPDHMIFVRHGYFYEMFGIDALLLMDMVQTHMNGKTLKAGVPLKNIQHSCDLLLARDMSIVIFEQAQTPKGIARVFAARVNRGNPVYWGATTRKLDTHATRLRPPQVGRMTCAHGILMTVFDADAATATTWEHLTPHAYATLLLRVGDGDVWSTEPGEAHLLTCDDPREFPRVFVAACMEAHGWSIKHVVFSSHVPQAGQPKPLYTPTAMQLGLLTRHNHTLGVPSLATHALPPRAPAWQVSSLSQFLQLPPSPVIRVHLRRLVTLLTSTKDALPTTQYVHMTPMLLLLRRQRASASALRKVHGLLCHVAELLSLAFFPSLFAVAQHVSGLDMDQASWQRQVHLCTQMLGNCLHVTGVDDGLEGETHPCMKALVGHVETWRGAVQQKRLRWDGFKAARETLSARTHGHQLAFRAREGRLVFTTRDIPNAEPFVSKGKLAKNAWTTPELDHACASYMDANDDMRTQVDVVLSHLCRLLVENKGATTLILAHQVTTLYATLKAHASHAVLEQWSCPTVDVGASRRLYMHNFWPYWMHARDAVRNTITMNGPVILTGANMGGKSTVMRSVCAVALLAHAGLAAPVEEASMTPMDAFFMHMAASDRPVDGKSAFAVEMDDAGIICKECTPMSYVDMDEIGRGTAVRDGSALAKALILKMHVTGVRGFFATHLHTMAATLHDWLEELRRSGRLLDLAGNRVVEPICHMHMGVEHGTHGLRLTHTLQPGVCTKSHALHTASRYLPADVLTVARTLLDEPVPKSASRPTLESVLYDIKGHVGVSQSLHVPPGHDPPPTTLQHSWLYVFLAEEEGNVRVYVGETDDLPSRTKTHRTHHAFRRTAHLYALKMQGKSQARYHESRTIRLLQDMDHVRVTSSKDGAHVHFGQL